MTREPTVTFVVPCYNYARFLPDCLRSIFAQEGSYDYQIIAVDDGSTDETQRVLERFEDQRLRVITHAKNQGHAVTINTALREARGRFVARIDPDDRYRPSFLNDTLPMFAARPDVGLVYGDAAIIDATGEVSADGAAVRRNALDTTGNELVALLEANFICAPTVIARREAWLAAGPVPEWLAFHDWFFTVMIARRWKFHYVSRVLADYRVHSQNHHTKVVRDKTEETSLFWLLDRVFSGSEDDAGLEAAKRAARPRIYGAQYLTLGKKYFGVGMYADARRCLLRAIRHHPAYALRTDVARWLAATCIGRAAYDAGKAAVRTALSRS